MSNTLAIATVSGVLQARLRSVLDANGLGGFVVRTNPPLNDPDAGVYLHLFRVAPNTSLQPESLPTRRRDGSVTHRPRIALNLHYQFTFVGNDANTDFDSERLAGLVLTELHARPILHPDEIATFLAGLGGGHVLQGADLGDQLDRIRVTMLSMDLEDYSRLWSMLNQSFHALTVAMEASVVLLDDEVEATVPLPVEQPAITVFPIASPQITSARSSARNQPIVQLFAAGDPDVENLILIGSGLVGHPTQVRVGGVLIDVDPANVSPTELSIALTDASGLAAGVVPVQVVHQIDVDPDPASENLRLAGQSGTLAVALAPTVVVAAVAADAGDHLVRLTVTPQPDAGQDVQLLLDSTSGLGQLRSQDWSVVGGDVDFRVVGAPGDIYLVRVVVDGATTVIEGGLDGPTNPVVIIP